MTTAFYRRLRPIHTFLFLALAMGSCASPPKSPATRGGVDAANNDHSVYVQSGKGSPAVVLQAGLGDDKAVWNQIIPALSREHTVIAFDRPGRGSNPVIGAPRDPCTIAAEQRVLLQSAGISPPYLLVGHSLGGLYQYAYAKLYPADVAGLVLVDPTSPKHWETMQREAPAAAALIKVMKAVAFSHTDRSEFDDQVACLERLDMSRPLSQPSRVLVAGRFRPEERGAFETMMKRSRQQWLKLTGTPQLDVIWDSGHYIQKESPEDVIAAVRQVAAEIRGRAMP